jgi:hypothetical protein
MDQKKPFCSFYTLLAQGTDTTYASGGHNGTPTPIPAVAFAMPLDDLKAAVRDAGAIVNLTLSARAIVAQPASDPHAWQILVAAP